MRLLDQRRAQAAARGWSTAHRLRAILGGLVAASGLLLVENQLTSQDAALVDHLDRERAALEAPPALPPSAASSTPEQRALATLLASPLALDPATAASLTASVEEAGAAREARDPLRLSAALQRLDRQAAEAREASVSARRRAIERATDEARSHRRDHVGAMDGALAAVLALLLGAQVYLAAITRRRLSPPLLLATSLALVTGAWVASRAAHGERIVLATVGVVTFAAVGLWTRWRELS